MKILQVRNLQKNNILFCMLVLLAVILKLFKLEIFFGISIDLSNIALILLLMIFGKNRAVLVALGVSITSILFFDGRYIDLMYVLEIYVLAIIAKKYRKLSIIICDLQFWIFIGMPIFYILGWWTNSKLLNDYYYFQLVFIFLNGIFNSFISELIYVYYVRDKIKNRRTSLTFRMILLHILTGAILIPFLTNIFVDIIKTNDYLSNNVDTYAKEVFHYISDDINSLDDRGRINLQLSSMIETGKLAKSIKIHSRYKPFNIHVLNKKNEVIVDVTNYEDEIECYDDYRKTEVYNDELYKMVPKNSTSNLINNTWINGFYIYDREIEDTGFSVIIEVPIEIYKDKITFEYISQFKFLLFFVVFIMFIAILLNKIIFNDLSKIASNTSNLSYFIDENTDINWPNSRIVEIRNLVNNIKNIGNELRWNFVEMKKSEKMLYDLAYYDTLTTLPNRLFFKKVLDESIKDYDEEEKIGIIFLDLNRFKIINDTLGHDLGDKLLRNVAKRLKTLRNDKLNVFRLGGDEFVIVCSIEQKSDLEIIGEKIVDKFKKSFVLNGVVLNVTCSLGASVYPDDSEDINNIIQYADIAMYIAKEEEDKKIHLFNDEMKEIFIEKLTIEKEIFNALENDEFTLYYQPKYDAKTEKVKSIEALIRWSSNSLGVVPPDKFISIAEESGLILTIDKWVMIKACIENKRLQDEGYAKVPIAVNISAKHFNGEEIERLVRHALDISGLDAKYLIIEITEGVLIKKVEIVQQIIKNLNSLGVSISIDDFGKGYSSFNQLMTLPINELKIDKVFIRDIQNDEKRASIVKTMVELAHRLELNVVAEGIETNEEKEIAKAMGCDELQGYLFAKPVTLEELKKILKQGGSESV